MKWLILVLAIIAEIIATSALKESDGFSKLKPTLIALFGYLIAFYFLSLTLKTIPLGITYALWSAVGIVFLSIIGYFRFHQTLDLPAILGITLIIIGVIVIQLFSKTMHH